MTEAFLALENGLIFKGRAFGARGERTGEVVFNTSLSGYQEILTDPSYKGQIVAMTYPLIGNYGVNEQDMESRQVWVEGFVVKELSKIYSNWRATLSLEEYLIRHNIIGIEGIDTRALTRAIRTQGAMRAAISTEDYDPQSLVSKARQAPSLIGMDLVKEVTCSSAYFWQQKAGRKTKAYVVVLDCGVKYSILRNLKRVGCQIEVVPAFTSAEDILARQPDGVVLSNGPGDPAAVGYVIETVRKILGKVPLFGICLGHQMLGLALGGKTYKLKFGHHGGNHPVKDIKTGKIAITSQNHGFCVDITSLAEKDILMTHINLYDRTLEGIMHKKMKAFAVQYHPEAGPGPHDAFYLFDEFINFIKKKRYA